MDRLRDTLITFLCALFGFLSPIRDFMTAIVLLFIVDFVCGLIQGLHDGEDWNWHKAFAFVIKCLIFFALATFIFVCGHFMHNDTGAIQCVSYICYVMFYFTGTNILKNIRVVVTNGTDLAKTLDFIIWVITLKIVEKIPFLAQYMSNDQRKGDVKKSIIQGNNSAINDVNKEKNDNESK